MAEFAGFFTTGASVGDQQVGGYTQAQMSIAQKITSSVNGPEGVAADYLNELAGTVGGANTVSINTGGALLDGKWYNNDASVNVNIPSAVGGGNTRIDRIVLRCSWAGFTVRITRIAGTDAASPTAPALTTTPGTLYDILLYQALVNTSGAVTLTDERAFALINTPEIADGAITAVKLADWAVTAVKIWDGQVTNDKLAALSVDTAKLANDAVTTAKILDANVTTAKIADANVTQAKLAPGASKVTNRQGGSATDWSTPGTTNYVPTAVKMQTGVALAELNNQTNSTLVVTFPVAFSGMPILLHSAGFDSDLIDSVYVNNASSFSIVLTNPTPVTATAAVNWIAVGQE